MKKIVFDLDNTLIPWKEEYWNTINETFEYFNIKYSEEDILKFKEAIDNYENEYDTYQESTMQKIAEDYLGFKLPDNFIEKWEEYLGLCAPETLPIDDVETFEYLSNKYELVVLTNWFTEQQKARLEKVGIMKYFKTIIGTDIVKNKPHKESYIKACLPYNLDECVMIGDSVTCDYEGALNAGMKAILYDSNNKNKIEGLKIKSMKELKKLL